MFPKKSYSVETRTASGDNQNVALLGMPSENDWVLYAPYTDKSMLRNTMTFEMARKMTGYASRARYCEVVVNGDYKGIYVLMERIKRDKNRVDIEKLNPDEISGENLTGGYILRVDKMDWDFNYATEGWLSEVTPFYPVAKRQTFQYFYPKADDIVSQQRNYIKNFVTLAETALISPDFKDPFLGYPAYFDLPSFVDFMLLSEVSKEVDKYKFSTYFYKENDRDGGKLFAGPAWDFNLGYGNVDYWPEGLKTTGWLYQTVTTGNPHMMYWWKRLMEDPYFLDLAKTRWVDLRQNSLTNAFIQQKVDSLIGEIDEAKERNYARWPILGEYVWPNHDWENNTYADEVEYFTNFLNNRLEYMDNHMPGNVLEPWVGISATANKISLTLYGDYFRRPLLSKDQFSLVSAPAYLSIQEVSYTGPTSCVLTLNSDVSALGNVSVKVLGNSINTLKDIESNKLSTTGISSLDKPIELNVYAFESVIYVDCSSLEEAGFAEVINLWGQRCGYFPLQSESLNSFQLDLSPGVYLVVVKAEKFSMVQRVVIVK
jgi:spore coat protein CotH